MKDRKSNIRFDFHYFENRSVDYIIGLDEAGRGPLAGPLLVGLYVLEKKTDDFIQGVDDSKDIPVEKRKVLFEKIKSKAYYWDYIKIDAKKIDELNIYRATGFGMKQLLDDLPADIYENSHILTDAMEINIPRYKYTKIIKGDKKSYSIGAASIIAKVLRDKIMIEYADKYPEYDFKNNKGYGTKKHIEALKKEGITPIHRHSFNPVRTMLKNKIQNKFKF